MCSEVHLGKDGGNWEKGLAMCFRPADAGQSLTCPECGKKVNAIMGNWPPNCPFCNLDLAEVTANLGSDAPAPASPGAPQPPAAAPGAPSAPKPPAAPGAN